jgi:hypothetical protein
MTHTRDKKMLSGLLVDIQLTNRTTDRDEE